MKTVMLMLSAMLAFSFGATAQQGGGRQRVSPEEMLKQRLETVKKEVKLTAEQEKQVSALFTETQKKQQEMFQASRTRNEGGGNQGWQEVREKMQKLQDEETAAIKKILNEEQFKAYSAMLEKQRKEQEERMRSRGQGGQGGPGGGGPGGGGPGGGGGPR